MMIMINKPDINDIYSFILYERVET